MSRGLLVWLLIMAVETAHGILRGILLVPAVGQHTASRIGWPIGMVIVLGLATLLVRWVGLTRPRSLLALGAAWMMLTFAFEIAIGWLRGLDAGQIWAEANPFAGGLMIYSLLVMLVAPYLAARWRGVVA